MKEFLAELDGAAPTDPGFSENLDKLMGDVRHHVEDEENELIRRTPRPATRPPAQWPRPWTRFGMQSGTR